MEKLNSILKSNELSGFRAYGEYHLGGKYVREFEREFRSYFKVKYAISMNSATACLHSALVSCGVGVGDEVIVTPYSFSSSASCVLMAGATPIFADIEDETFCIDPSKIKKLITSKTKAIIPVHLMGHPADMDRIKGILWNYRTFQGQKIFIIEDCAQAIGATYHSNYVGTIGDCGVFSFNQSKHINTGEGGMLITNDDKIADRARAVRNHGELSRPELKVLGYNYRMTEIEACIGLDRFKNINELIDIRIRNAEQLTKGLNGIVTTPVIKPDCKHVFNYYALKVKNKERFCEELGKKGIYFGAYVKPLYLLPIYGYGEGLCPVAERMWKDEFVMTDIIKYKDLDIERVVRALQGMV